MTATGMVARPMLAGMFVFGGIESLRDPKSRVVPADKVAPAIARRVGLPEDTELLVRINGGAQVAAGLMLATGKLPRVASLVLAGSLVPTTLAAHRFWEETDPSKRHTQQIQFLKNTAMLGGLLLAAADTGGRPSITWRAKRKARRARRASRKAMRKAAKGAGAVAAVPDLTRAASNVGSTLRDRVDTAEVAAMLHDVAGGVHDLGGALQAMGREAAESFAPRAKEAFATAVPKAKDAVAVAVPKAKDAVAVAVPKAKDAVAVAVPKAKDAVAVAAPMAREAVTVAAPKAREAVAAAKGALAGFGHDGGGKPAARKR